MAVRVSYIENNISNMITKIYELYHNDFKQYIYIILLNLELQHIKGIYIK